MIEFKSAGNLCPRDAFVYIRNHTWEFCPGLHSIPSHTPWSSKGFAMAHESGEHLLWDQLCCGLVQPAGNALEQLKDPKSLCHSCLYFSFPAVSRRKKRAFLLDDTDRRWCKGRSLTLSNSSLILNTTGSSRAQRQAWLRGVSNPVPSAHVTKPLAHSAAIGISGF